MKKIAFVIAACMLLASCGSQTVYTVSANAQGSADALYVAAEKAGEALVATNVITAAKFVPVADKVYTALTAFRSAAAGFRAVTLAGGDTTAALAAQTQALADFNAALADFQTLVGVPPTAATAL